MDNLNPKQQFARTFNVARRVFRQPELSAEDTAELASIFMAALADLDLADCTKALSDHIANGKFMPVPADIRERLVGATTARAAAAWPEVMRLASNCMEAKSEDPTTEAVVRALGGWQRIGRSNSQELVWIQKEFQERYQQFLDTPTLVQKTLGQRTNGPRRIGEQSNVRGIR